MSAKPDIIPEGYEEDYHAKTLAGLTHRQRLFVLYYVGEARGNATEAACLAGYSGTRAALSVAGAKNLRLEKVSKAIDAFLKPMVMSATELVWRISEDAKAAAYLDLSEPGQPRIDLERLEEEGLLHLVKEVETTTVYSKRDGETEIEAVKVKVKMVDPQAAKRDLARIKGLFRDKVEVSGEVKVSGEQYDRAARRGKAKAKAWREKKGTEQGDG